RSGAVRAADAIAGFVGTISFVAIHLAWFTLWAVINGGLLAFVRPFDPYPFHLLAMIVSLEAVLLSTFVLIKQNRMGYLSDRRAHLDLQVNLLTEHEVTRLLRLSEAIAVRVGAREEAGRSGRLVEETEVETLVEHLDSKLTDED
ncbi:MAG: DUF1003 domain-containing protein, partial [Acetobacteraceae bacterium]|nr:DUF1003 domain-containing protein [Acetobacteraceae bacterium]